ncbi:MAG: hypothetical protein KKB51_02475 [Candidatus Riflebacteria bacterium]|nr:hypothetical protein [Candidatus Riflebacteria bacterium]
MTAKDASAKKENYKQAMQYFIKAAKLKHGEGFFEIGRLLFSGRGTEENKQKA